MADLLSFREADYNASIAAMIAAHASGASRSDLRSMADVAYGKAVSWSLVAGNNLAVKGWSDDDARKASARADSAIWNAINLGGNGGR